MTIPAGYPSDEDPTAGSSSGHERWRGWREGARPGGPTTAELAPGKAGRDLSGRLGELQARRAAALEPDAEHEGAPSRAES
jgi:hypothetical protein